MAALLASRNIFSKRSNIMRDLPLMTQTPAQICLYSRPEKRRLGKASWTNLLGREV